MSAEPQARATFGDELYLVDASVTQLDPHTLPEFDIYWGAGGPVAEDLIVFVHVNGPQGLVGQDDRAPAWGRWRGSWWQPGVVLHDQHVLTLSEPLPDHNRHQVELGLYRASSGERLPVVDAGGRGNEATSWVIGRE